MGIIGELMFLCSANKNLNDIRKIYRNNGMRAINIVQLMHFFLLRVVFQTIQNIVWRNIISKNNLILIRTTDEKYIKLYATLLLHLLVFDFYRIYAIRQSRILEMAL